MTLISHELPKCLFKTSPLINDYPFGLAHLLNVDKEYSDYYRDQFKKHKFSILDNGCFELDGKTVDTDLLSNLIQEYKPSHYVLPDIFYDCEQTISLATNFLKLKSYKLNSQPIGVLQGRNFFELEKCLNFYIDRQVKYIAISYGLLPDGDLVTSRYLFFKKFRKKLEFRQIHFLGVGNPAELLLYSGEDKKLITSIDTSAPVIQGWKGVRFSDNGYKGVKPKEKLAENLDIEFNDQALEDTFYNVKKFREYLK